MSAVYDSQYLLGNAVFEWQYAVPDTTAPILTSPTGTKTGSTTASGTVSTDEGNGTLYYLASINATETAATIKAASSQAVTATGTQNVSFTGLNPATTYYAHYVHVDAATNESNVVSSASFTTDAVTPEEVVRTVGGGVGSEKEFYNLQRKQLAHQRRLIMLRHDDEQILALLLGKLR